MIVNFSIEFRNQGAGTVVSAEAYDYKKARAETIDRAVDVIGAIQCAAQMRGITSSLLNTTTADVRRKWSDRTPAVLFLQKAYKIIEGRFSFTDCEKAKAFGLLADEIVRLNQELSAPASAGAN